MSEELDQEANFAGDTVPYIPRDALARVIVTELYDMAEEFTEHLRESAKVLGQDHMHGAVVIAEWHATAHHLKERIGRAKQVI